MLNLDDGVVSHHGFDHLNGIENTDDLSRFWDNAVRFRFDNLDMRFSGLRYGGLWHIDQLLVLLDYILLADFLEAIVGAFQQVGQHLLDRFVGTRIALNAYLAQFRFAESHIQFVVGEEFFQSLIQGT